MYGITNSGNLFAGELTEWLLDSGFIKYQYQMSIYYKYAPYGTKIVFKSYVDDCVYWYTSEYIRKWFVDALGNRFHINLLEYADCFMLIRISHMKDNSIPLYQARYATSIVAKYLDTDTVETRTKFYKTTLKFDIIIAKYYVSNRDEQVDELTWEFNIHYGACIGSLIYF